MSTKHPLAVWREANDETQESFGTKVGLSRWYINQIERRQRLASRDAIAKIIKATNNSVVFEDFLPVAAPVEKQRGAA